MTATPTIQYNNSIYMTIYNRHILVNTSLQYFTKLTAQYKTYALFMAFLLFCIRANESSASNFLFNSYEDYYREVENCPNLVLNNQCSHNWRKLAKKRKYMFEIKGT